MPTRAALLSEYTDKSITEGRRLFGRLTNQERALPDFLVIGAQKGGTTSLYNYLAEHPRVAPALKKEIHFFDNNYARGLKWYRSHFPRRSALADGQGGEGVRSLAGEASPYYLFHPLAPERAWRTIPDARLIVMLRDPVGRALSHHQHNVRKGDESLPFGEALAREAERLEGEEEALIRDPTYRSARHQNFSYKARGIYINQLRRWERWFPAAQILVLQSESFYRDPRGALDQVTDFLMLPRFHPDTSEKHNTGSYARMDSATRDSLLAHFAPHNLLLEQHLGTSFGWGD